MSEPFTAEIRIWANNFAPRGWAYCNGQTLQIDQNTALFALLGTTFGGNGRTTFQLPDLQGRAPLHVGGTSGQGTGLSPYSWGQRGGSATVTLTQANLPEHNHRLRADREFGNSQSPTDGYIAIDNVGTDREFAPDTNTLDVTLNEAQLASTGSSHPHNNMQPFLALGFCIALVGLFPSQS